MNIVKLLIFTAAALGAISLSSHTPEKHAQWAQKSAECKAAVYNTLSYLAKHPEARKAWLGAMCHDHGYKEIKDCHWQLDWLDEMILGMYTQCLERNFA